jgi:signal transduction histidine kinase
VSSGPRLLDAVRSVKVKLGLLILASVLVAILVGSLGHDAGVATWVSVPVTLALALGVTQLLAVGMTSPLREMTEAARRMATGDYSTRVTATSSDEVGQLARAFNQMAADLAAVDRQRRELVANVSHELRTPLTALTALLENLADGVSPASPAALESALAQAERLSTLVGDLLDLARVDAGKAPLARASVDVAALLAQAAAEANGNAQQTGRRVTVLTDAPAGLVVEADAARLRQLVANLLDNATRHSPAGGIVRLTAAPLPEGWRLEVQDAGPGIAAVDRERVFERFGTLTDPTADGGTTGGGTGLGLAIARWVTDLHGGSIGFVDPPPGSTGALVRVDLPLAPPSRPAAPAAPTAPTRQEVTMTAEAPEAPLVASAPSPTIDELFGSFWPERGLGPQLRALGAALAVGILAALVVPERDAGLGTSLVLLSAGGAVLAFARHRRTPFTLACAALCAALALVPTLRDADWVVVPALLAGGAVCVAGLTHGRTLPAFVLAGLAWPLAGLRGLPLLGRTLGALGSFGNGPAIVRTVLWSVLGLVVFGLLFTSADAVFAEWTDALVPDLGLDAVVPRIFFTFFVGGVVLAATYLGLNPPRVDAAKTAARPVAHRFEWLAPVLLVDAVFVAFLVAQATVVFGGHDYLQRTTGLTYAEYVHQGFGQLTVATALTLLVVWAAARKAPRATSTDRLWIRGSLGLLCVATLVVVASALNRMHLYQEAYGFTRLRLLVDLFEGWLGFLVLAVLAAGVSLKAAWLPRTALLTGAGVVLGLALLNPDAWIAQHNIDRYRATGKVDWTYLQDLSDDAAPTLAGLTGTDRLCAFNGRHAFQAQLLQHDDWLEWNLGRARGHDDDVRFGGTHAVTCPGVPAPSTTTRP